MATLVAEGMKEAGYGRIINIVSTSVKIPLHGLGVSNTIRGAVASWAKTMANELGKFGVTVNNVLPGATSTERLTSIVGNKSAKTGKSEEEVANEMMAEIPAGRFGKPEEIAAVVAFLASPAAAYVNGTSIPVDGGRTGCI
jgi:3-oxoacyl-[acyl-carrier protein] reductase